MDLKCSHVYLQLGHQLRDYIYPLFFKYLPRFNQHWVMGTLMGELRIPSLATESSKCDQNVKLAPQNHIDTGKQTTITKE